MGDAEKKADKNTVYADAVAESLIEKEYFLRKVYENPAIDRTIRNAASMGQTQIYSYMRESVVMRQSYVEKVYGGDFSSYRQDLNVAKAADKDMPLPRTLAEDMEEDKETERD